MIKPPCHRYCDQLGNVAAMTWSRLPLAQLLTENATVSTSRYTSWACLRSGWQLAELTEGGPGSVRR